VIVSHGETATWTAATEARGRTEGGVVLVVVVVMEELVVVVMVVNQ